MKPSNGNQHRKKKLPLLIAKAINSLPHKSGSFCSPMLLWKPRSGNQDLETSICCCSFEDLVTDILNAHITQKFEKKHIEPSICAEHPLNQQMKSENETRKMKTRKCASTPNHYTTFLHFKVYENMPGNGRVLVTFLEKFSPAQILHSQHCHT